MWIFRDIIKMIRDLRAEAPWLDRWGAALNLPQLIGGLVFVTRAEGIAVLVGNVISLVIAAQIHRRRPFSRLTSICHVVWLPVLALLLVALMQSGFRSVFAMWALYVVVTMVISLVLDVANLYRFYFSEDRSLLR